MSRRPGLAVEEPTELRANSEILAKRFRKLLCPGNRQHAIIEGNRSRPAQIWTWTMARLIA
eukprot:9305180-Lingulodinium_polyedra.AAC.1